MTVLRLGLLVAEVSILEHVRPEDAVELVVLRNTLLDMPRTSTARRLATRIHELVPDVAIVPYAWHLVTHAADDALPGRGARSVEGDPHRVGHLAETSEVQAAWEASVRAAEAMEARHIVLRTPPSFAPGTRGRQRLRQFVEGRAAGGPSLVWEPEGLWEPEEVDALSAQLGLIALAPLPPDGAPQFEGRWLVHGVGGSPAQLAGGAAESLADELAYCGADEATLLFAGSAGLKNLRRLRRVLPEL